MFVLTRVIAGFFPTLFLAIFFDGSGKGDVFGWAMEVVVRSSANYLRLSGVALFAYFVLRARVLGGVTMFTVGICSFLAPIS